ncbi:FAD-dependent oxidoreductase [Patescibacteria group bacterium]|nr:FAD-dependent oxidoreductase [Patescibacteria group bacterium]
MYDLIIIGAGPAGTAAGVYAARKKLKTLLITEEFGGQSSVSETIYNWIGSPEIGGQELAKAFQSHLEYYEDGETLTIHKGTRAASVANNDDGSFTITDAHDNAYQTRAVFIASGSARRKLPATGADRLEHKGLTYCASCDGPLFSGMDVVVIGGGNAGFETAAQLLAYCKSVTLLQHRGEYKADPITVEKVLSRGHMTGILNAKTLEVTGEQFVDGLVYEDVTTGKQHRLEVKGIFVEIGQIPNSGIVEDLVDLTDSKQIIADPYTQRTSVPGIWAAGDVTDVRYHQNNISAGDAVKALEDIYQYLHRQ